jgi:NAD+ synthase
LSPIADLLKSEVRLLAKYVQVPESILTAKPTDGLFGDETSDEVSDEDQLGASYDELEWAMEQIEKGMTVDCFTGREAVVFLIYKQLNFLNKHKINPIPVCKILQKLK